MNHFQNSIAKFAFVSAGFLTFSLTASAADLGSFIANCDAAAAPPVVHPISGQVGDTFTVTTAGDTSTLSNGCWPSASNSGLTYTLTNSYANNYSNFVLSGTVITVTLAANGSSTLYVQHNANNAGGQFVTTIAAAPAAAPTSVPTMSEYTLGILALLTAFAGALRMRRRF